MKSFIKKYLRKNIIFYCLIRILYNLYSRLCYCFGRLNTDSGATHTHLDAEGSLSYIRTVFEDYKHYANISHFYGQICELGPGDSSGLALLLLADGATHVDMADRYYSNRNVRYHAKIYKALGAGNSRIAAILKAANLEDETSFPGIKRYYGSQAAGETFFENRPSFYDFIISRSVMEHTTDPIKTLGSMYKALKPGGLLIHKVDLRDHGLLTPYHHSLKFLEIPGFVYHLMTYKSGLPNRILIDQYKDWACKVSPDAQFLVTQLAYGGAIEPHVPFESLPSPIVKPALNELRKHKGKFAASFRNISENDLIVGGFFLILKKTV